MSQMEYRTDVLIVGGGSSGMWAARHIKELDPSMDVLIIDKGPKEWGGLMSMCGGDIDVVMPDENVKDWVRELTYYWDGLCDQNLVLQLLNRSYDRFRDYQELGCHFFKNPDGSLRSVLQRGLKHCKLYPAQLKGTGGRDMVNGLRGKLQELGVHQLGRSMVTDLLFQPDGRVNGAIGFDGRTGEFFTVQCAAVLIASGQAEWKPAYSQNTATGEGMELAFRAGVDFQNFEFVKVWNVPKDFTWEGQTTLLPLGGRFVNRLGEPIMDRYMPALGSNTDPHYITRAMALEVQAGRGPIYMDTSQIRKEDMELLIPQTGWQLANYQKLVRRGMDLFQERTEWIPHLQDTCGGICADLYGQTNVPGIFAAGRARSIDPGVYIGGFAMCTTAVTGHLAAEGMVEFVHGAAPVTALDPAQVDQAREALYAPLGKEGIPPHAVLSQLRQILFPYDVCILKSEASLTRALNELLSLKEGDYAQMTAADPHYLLKAREVKGMMWAAECYLRASLERKESRSGHFRTDYPTRSGPPTWFVLHNDGGEIRFTTRKVPVEDYPFQVDHFYSDQFQMNGGRECS